MTVLKKNILFLPIHEPSFREHLVLAKWIKSNTSYNPIFIISNYLVEKFVNELEDADITSVKVYKDRLRRVKINFKNRAISYFYNFIKSSSLKLFFDYLKAKQNLQIDYKKALDLISNYKPAAVFLTGDRHLGFELPLIKAAKTYGIKTVIVPVSYSDPEGSFKIRCVSREYRVDSFFPIFNHIFFSKKEMQKQIYHSSDGNFAFYNAGITLALYKNNMLPPNPWVMGGGNSDIIAVDGEDAKERYIKLGVPENKIIITGHQSHDILYQNYTKKDVIKRKIYEKYYFNPEKKLIVFGVPHLAEHKILSWSDHWKEIDFLVQTLASLKQNLLLSLHPKSNFLKYQFLEKKYNCKIAKEPLVEILVAADCYVATFSSTIQWAILCRIPSVVVDFYNLNYNVFDKFKGVIIVNKKDLLESTIKKILVDENYYKFLQTKQNEMAKIIAPFDGKSCARIVEIIENLCTKS